MLCEYHSATTTVHLRGPSAGGIQPPSLWYIAAWQHWHALNEWDLYTSVCVYNTPAVSFMCQTSNVCVCVSSLEILKKKKKGVMNMKPSPHASFLVLNSLQDDRGGNPIKSWETSDGDYRSWSDIAPSVAFICLILWDFQRWSSGGSTCPFLTSVHFVHWVNQHQHSTWTALKKRL